ncbi:MAG: hypothetical protein GY832_26920 [Chloroflexi bacterium]|nr:hypothetical protein [Chloroflexota bacterium]
MKKLETRVLLRNLAIELILYGIFVAIYTITVLQLLSEPLTQLFHTNLVTYAIIGLGLIVVQGAFLDVITSFLLQQLRLEQLE